MLRRGKEPAVLGRNACKITHLVCGRLPIFRKRLGRRESQGYEVGQRFATRQDDRVFSGPRLLFPVSRHIVGPAESVENEFRCCAAALPRRLSGYSGLQADAQTALGDVTRVEPDADRPRLRGRVLDVKSVHAGDGVRHVVFERPPPGFAISAADNGPGIGVFLRVDMDSTIPAREGPGGDLNRSGPRGSEAQ